MSGRTYFNEVEKGKELKRRRRRRRRRREEIESRWQVECCGQRQKGDFQGSNET
jgi:hypothetical protein